VSIASKQLTANIEVANSSLDTAKVTQVEDVEGVASFFRGFLNKAQ